MILTCPSCRTKYVVPDSAIGLDGRRVRCAQCRFSWFQDGPDALPDASVPPAAPATPRPAPVAPPASDPAAEQPPMPVADTPPAEPEPQADPAVDTRAVPDPASEATGWTTADQESDDDRPPVRARRNPARMWTWIAVISALLMVGALTAIYFIGPQQIAAWMNGGAAPTSADDALRFTRRDLAREPLPTDRELFTVTGEITNVSGETQRIPQIRAEVTDADQNVIFAWTIAPPASELGAGQAITFSSASTDVPKGGRSLSLRFAAP